jgi:sigma-E factor negative regulatory protein RseC
MVRKMVDSSSVEVEIARSTSCGGNCKDCGGQCSGTGMIVVLANDIGARPGDMVRIESRAGSVVSLALLVYIVPVIVMILGMVYGSRLAGSILQGIDPDAAGLIFGVSGLLIFFFLLRMIDRRLSAKGGGPVITAILNR